MCEIINRPESDSHGKVDVCVAIDTACKAVRALFAKTKAKLDSVHVEQFKKGVTDDWRCTWELVVSIEEPLLLSKAATEMFGVRYAKTYKRVVVNAESGNLISISMYNSHGDDW